MSRRSRTLVQTFAWPMLLAAITLAALVLGLASEGASDLVAVLGLAAPLAVGLILAFRGRAASEQSRSQVDRRLDASPAHE